LRPGWTRPGRSRPCMPHEAAHKNWTGVGVGEQPGSRPRVQTRATVSPATALNCRSDRQQAPPYRGTGPRPRSRRKARSRDGAIRSVHRPACGRLWALFGSGEEGEQLPSRRVCPPRVRQVAPTGPATWYSTSLALRSGRCIIRQRQSAASIREPGVRQEMSYSPSRYCRHRAIVPRHRRGSMGAWILDRVAGSGEDRCRRPTSAATGRSCSSVP